MGEPTILSFPAITISLLVPVLYSFIIPYIRASFRTITFLAGLTLFLPGIVGSLTYIYYGNPNGVADAPFANIARIGSLTFFVDAISLPVLIGASLVSGAVAFYSLPYMEKRVEEMGLEESHLRKYFLLYQLFSSTMIGVILANNLIVFYLFLEISLIASFLLINWYGYGDRKRIAILYFVWTHIGAALFLLGAITYGLLAKTFDFYTAQNGLLYGMAARLLESTFFKIALYSILFGLLVKMAIFGVHFWLPYAHAEAPTPISALLSPVLIGLGGYGIVRIIYTLFEAIPTGLQEFLLVLSLFTILYGGFNALSEKDLKRIFAYSSISQMGYVLLGIVTLVPAGITGSLFHILAHSFGKALLFMSAGVIIYYYEQRKVEKLGGLAHATPYTAVATLIGFLAISGIPPAIGFWSELLIIGGLAKYASSFGIGLFLLILLVFIAGVGLTIAYSFLTMKRVFFGSLKEDYARKNETGSLRNSLLFVIVLTILFFIIFGYIAKDTLQITGVLVGS